MIREQTSERGFTLIELLAVIVIIGILAVVAIPKFTQSRERAFVSTMKADLRNLGSQQAIYYTDNLAYSSDFLALEYSPSEGVTVVITEDSNTGWSARAEHSGSDVVCAVFSGDAAPVMPATVGGLVTCV